MKPYKLVKWAIVGVLFALTTISGLCLYLNEKDKINVTDNKELITLRNQIKHLKHNRNSIEKNIKSYNATIKKDSIEIEGYNKIITENENSPELKAKANATIDSLLKASKKSIGISGKSKTELKEPCKQIDNLENQLKVEKKKGNSIKPSYKPSVWTIIHFAITAILLAASLVLFILFSGILKLIKRKKKNMDQTNNNNQQPDPMEYNNAADTTSNIIEPVEVIGNGFNFELPDPKLSYEITKGQNQGDCNVIIKCTRDDAEIRYCIAPDTANVINYVNPITVSRKCTLLVMAACGEIRSKQLNIVVDPNNVAETPSTQNTIATPVNEEGNRVKPVPEPNVEEKPQDQLELSKVQEDRIRVFTSERNVLGISYQGDNHIKAKPVVPCQDCHSFTKVNDVWSIAIVSDGAGSKKHSDIGSKAVCLAFTTYLSYKLQKSEHFANGNIPNERIWDLEFRAILTRFQEDIKTHKNFASFEFESLAATIVILAYSPKGYLFAHIGDGRAGVKVNGEWKSILTPHKGAEANQTIFSTTVEFINKPTLMMSGVFVPETKVEECNLEAFVLMSDGCEDGAWATYQKVNLPNGDFRVEDVNQPRSQTLEGLMSIVDSKDGQKSKLVEFITSYNKGFKTEGDDKTILIGEIK